MPDKHPIVSRVIKGLGLNEPGELLRWAPKGYRDYRNPSESIRECEGKGRVAMTVRILSRRDYDKNGVSLGSFPNQRPFRISMQVEDATGFSCRMTVFGNVFPWKDIGPGHTVTVFAETEIWNEQIQIRSPELLPVNVVGKMLSQYPGKRGRVSAESVSAAIDALLGEGVNESVDALVRDMGLSESDILRRSGCRYSSLATFFHALHRPADLKEAFRATDEARELTAFHLKNLARRVRERAPTEAARILIDQADVDALIEAIPYQLTVDQLTAIAEIVDDLRKPLPMRRLLSGDVGTGKTLTYMVPAIAALKKGAIVAVVTPNTVLAQQFVGEVAALFPSVSTSLITGASKKRIDEGSLMVGTTALINQLEKKGLIPDLLICDEQHRLGRAQRESLLGQHSNLLEATATAIPRTVAMATHGGMDVSILRQSPVEKQIRTSLVERDKRKELFAGLADLVQGGGKIAIIYPRLEDGGEARESVIEAEKQWNKLFPGMVAMVHGRLKDDEKIAVIDAMKCGKKQILIATTVLELGVTIKGLIAMLVIAPDRYGVGQLHQLRGRLARDGGVGFMFMYLQQPIEAYEQETIERLRRVEAVADGFELAEQDAYARGFGDLAEDGDSQNGKMPVLFFGIKLSPSDLIE